MPNNDGTQPATTHAVRLIFEYDGDQVRLISQHAVDIVMTGFDSAQAAQHAGVYVDSRDKEGMTLARVPARNAFATSEEVFPERMDEPIVRRDLAKPKGAFTVIVPAPPATDKITVVR